MKSKLSIPINIIVLIIFLLLFTKFIIRNINRLKTIDPIYGEYIKKNSFMVGGDFWPFTFNEVTIFCKGTKKSHSLFLESNENFYSLNESAKDEFGYPFSNQILRLSPDQKATKKDINLGLEMLIKRAKNNCDLKNSTQNNN